MGRAEQRQGGGPRSRLEWTCRDGSERRACLRSDPELRRRGRRREVLSELEQWKRARVVKCNPDPPQIPVRLRALYDGKLLFSPVPISTKGFPYLRIDPDRLAAKGVDFETAATSQGFLQCGEPVGFEDMPKLDFCIVGCVAVTAARRPHGQGGRLRRSRTGSFSRTGPGRRFDSACDDGPFLASRRGRGGRDGERRLGARLHRDRARADRHPHALSGSRTASPGTRSALTSSKTFLS